MVIQSIESLESDHPTERSHGGKVQSVSASRSIHQEHVLAVRRNVLNTVMRIASLFAVLSDPTRLQVVYAVLRAGYPKCACLEDYQ